MTLVEALEKLEAAGRIRSRWLPGMMDDSGDRVLQVDRGVVTVDRISRDGHEHITELAEHLFEPDRHDSLTTMGLTLLLREAMGDESMYAHPYRHDTEGKAWAVSGWKRSMEFRSAFDGSAKTERAAIEAAIIATAEGLE